MTTWLLHLQAQVNVLCKDKSDKRPKKACLPSEIFKTFPEASPGNFCLNIIVRNWVTSAFLAARESEKVGALAMHSHLKQNWVFFFFFFSKEG